MVLVNDVLMDRQDSFNDELEEVQGWGTSPGSFGAGASLGQHQGSSEFPGVAHRGSRDPTKEAGTFTTHGFSRVRLCVLQEDADLLLDHRGISARPLLVVGGEHGESEGIVPTSRTLTHGPGA